MFRGPGGTGEDGERERRRQTGIEAAAERQAVSTDKLLVLLIRLPETSVRPARPPSLCLAAAAAAAAAAAGATAKQPLIHQRRRDEK